MDLLTNVLDSGAGSTSSTTSGSTSSSTGSSTPEFMQGSGISTNVPGQAPNTNPSFVGAQVVPPGAGESAYQYENFVSGQQVQIGSDVANMLGIQAGTYTPAQLYQDMAGLTQAKLAEFQQFLYQAGYYTDSQGQPLQGMVFGALDNQSFTALANASMAALNSGTTLDKAATLRIGSGAGQLAQTSMPQAVTGGGNTYNIDLSNPQDVKYAADQIFQAALGRNAKADEVDKITSSLRSQQVSQGLAKEQGAEQSSKQRYNTEVNQRNTQFNFAHSPKTALGQVPNGPFNDPVQASIGLLHYMNKPVTASNIQFLVGLSQASGGSGMNLWGVQNTPTGGFQSWAQSLQATAQTLMGNGYGNIFAHLAAGDAGNAATDPQVQAELKKWGVKGGDISSQVSNAQGQANEAAFYYAQSQTPGTATGGPSGQGFTDPGVQTARVSSGVNPLGNSQTGVPAADVGGGQTSINPGDAYINPTTVYSVNPASEGAAAYNAATTGSNRIAYGANNYLNAFNAVRQMIQSGGPTG